MVQRVPHCTQLPRSSACGWQLGHNPLPLFPSYPVIIEITNIVQGGTGVSERRVRGLSYKREEEEEESEAFVAFPSPFRLRVCGL